MELKIGNWEITKNTKYNIRNAFNGDNKIYVCKGPFNKHVYDRINLYDKFKSYNLPLLPIVETLIVNNDLFIIFKEAIPIRCFKNFSTEKIIAFIIDAAKFHYETGYCIVGCADNLFVRNGEICFDPFRILKEYFNESQYFTIIYSIFDDYENKEICEKVIFIIKQLSFKDKNFKHLEKTLLSL